MVLNPDVAVEHIKSKIMNMSKQLLNQNENNGFMISVESVAKGSLFNVCQMTVLLGQQCINGNRLTDGESTSFDQDLLLDRLDLG